MSAGVRFAVCGWLALVPVAAGAQAPAPPPATDSYIYEPAGRRDPFLNLLATGLEEDLTAVRPEGAAGLTTAELSVRGVVQSRGALVAMIQGPDDRTYIVRPGDRLLDGTIKAVVPEGLIIVQAISDPLSLVKEREVRRLLRSLEDGKE